MPSMNSLGNMASEEFGAFPDGAWDFEPTKSTKRVADGQIDVAADKPARVSVPVVLQDERLSSHEADVRLAVRERDWRVRKKTLDAAAATAFKTAQVRYAVTGPAANNIATSGSFGANDTAVALAALTAKAPDEVDAYRTLVLEVASAVAEAKGGVTPVEEETLAKLRSALGQD